MIDVFLIPILRDTKTSLEEFKIENQLFACKTRCIVVNTKIIIIQRPNFVDRTAN